MCTARTLVLVALTAALLVAAGSAKYGEARYTARGIFVLGIGGTEFHR